MMNSKARKSFFNTLIVLLLAVGLLLPVLPAVAKPDAQPVKVNFNISTTPGNEVNASAVLR
jgi:hypothetical protein